MTTSVLLFRGINVGGRNILPMKALSALLKANGFSSVQTYIQSGNVVVEHASKISPDKVTTLIQEAFGFSPDTLILSASDFISAIAHNPFADGEGKAVHFYFCAQTPAPNTEKINQLKTGTEHWEVVDKVCYLHTPDGFGRSKLASGMERCLGVSATARNLNTVNKLHAMLRQP